VGTLLQQSVKKTLTSTQTGLAFGHVFTTDKSLEIERARTHERCVMRLRPSHRTVAAACLGAFVNH
jgi:hypothetical protein